MWCAENKLIIMNYNGLIIAMLLKQSHNNYANAVCKECDMSIRNVVHVHTVCMNDESKFFENPIMIAKMQAVLSQ